MSPQTTGSPGAMAPRYRWVVLAIAWAAFTLSFVNRLAWGNLQLQVGQTLGLPMAGLGIFVSAFYGGYVLSNVVTGFATDVLGPRLVLSVSAGLLGLATAAFAFTGSVAVGLIFQIIMGFAAGSDYAACVKLMTAWFPLKERGRAIGLWFTGSSIAVVLTNAFVPWLAATLGWQGAYHVLGAATVLIALLSGVMLRDGPEKVARPPKPDIRALLGNREILLVSLAGFGALWGTWGFAFWANALMIRGHGLAPGRAAGIVALFGAGAAIAKPLVGWLSDWMGGTRKPLAFVCLIGFTGMLLLFGTLESELAFQIAAPFLGVTAFAYSPLLTALVAELAGREAAGSASGVTNAFWQLGNLAVPLVVGLVFQMTGSFIAAFATLACGPLLGTTALLAVQEKRADKQFGNVT
jgi:sugar phosphate permease